jgi:tetratricopeptide (TPR) repeat protein
MATKKRPALGAPGKNPAPAPHSAAYETLLKDYAAALDLLRRGEIAAARDEFTRVAAECIDEPVLADRSRSFAAICERKLVPAATPPSTADACYHEAVMRCNNGEAAEAIRLLDQAMSMEPASARLYYARAAAWALEGNTESAVGDLRQAIGIEPTLRYQAGNDPDFESIREEPAFIDIIEPTPTGA